eukprot:jgi/Tetstr1/445970/TSEL_000299.t1
MGHRYDSLSRSRSRSRSPRRGSRRDRRDSRSPDVRRRDHHSERSSRRDRAISPRRDNSDGRRDEGKHHGYGAHRRHSREDSRGRRSSPPRDDARGEPQYDGRTLPPPPPQRSLPPPPPAELDEPPEVGRILQATVRSVRPFGIFVRMRGFSRDGLVHSTQVSADIEIARDDEDDMKVKAMEFVAAPGEEVWVKVMEVREEQPGRFRIGCSMKAVSQEDGTDLDPGGHLAGRRGGGGGGGGDLKEGAPELYSIHEATVKSIKPYGLFVQLDGWRRYGLVPNSQVSDHLGLTRDDSDAEKVATLEGVVSVEERIWVKVVETTEDERGVRIGCSMKLVAQGDGQDLDPTNLQYRPRGEAGPGGRAPVGKAAGAVKGTTIDWGHLAAGEYQHGDQRKKYDILADEEEGAGPSQGRPPPGHSGLPPPLPLPPAMMAPRGRGRGMTMPAWMTSGEPPSALGAPPPPEEPAAIGSVEEALAILERFKKHGKSSKEHKKKHKKGGKEHKHGKDRSSKKSKKSKSHRKGKDKDKQKDKDKGKRHRSRSPPPSSSSSSSGGSASD